MKNQWNQSFFWLHLEIILKIGQNSHCKKNKNPNKCSRNFFKNCQNSKKLSLSLWNKFPPMFTIQTSFLHSKNFCHFFEIMSSKMPSSTQKTRYFFLFPNAHVHTINKIRKNDVTTRGCNDLTAQTGSWNFCDRIKSSNHCIIIESFLTCFFLRFSIQTKNRHPKNQVQSFYQFRFSRAFVCHITL